MTLMPVSVALAAGIVLALALDLFGAGLRRFAALDGGTPVDWEAAGWFAPLDS